jgi:hypothetical protein
VAVPRPRHRVVRGCVPALAAIVTTDPRSLQCDTRSLGPREGATRLSVTGGQFSRMIEDRFMPCQGGDPGFEPV